MNNLKMKSFTNISGTSFTILIIMLRLDIIWSNRPRIHRGSYIILDLNIYKHTTKSTLWNSTLTYMKLKINLFRGFLELIFN